MLLSSGCLAWLAARNFFICVFRRAKYIPFLLSAQSAELHIRASLGRIFRYVLLVYLLLFILSVIMWCIGLRGLFSQVQYKLSTLTITTPSVWSFLVAIMRGLKLFREVEICQLKRLSHNFFEFIPFRCSSFKLLFELSYLGLLFTDLTLT